MSAEAVVRNPGSSRAGELDSKTAATGASLPVAAEVEELSRRIERDLDHRWRIDSLIGRGAFATVWRAIDSSDGRTVAIKRLESGAGGADRSGFYRELSILLRLRDPRIVQIESFLEAPRGGRYLVLEHCSGGSLRGALNRLRRIGARLAPDDARALVADLLGALEAAHRLGYAHRDLKPENVLFRDPERDVPLAALGVKVADFGLARTLAGQPESGVARALSGSPAYMAPEQFTGEFGARSDLYSLGVLAFEVLHGRTPFEGSPEALARAHLHEPPPIDTTLPAPWPELLAALLAKRPADRPASAAEAAAFFAASARRATRPARPEPRCLGVEPQSLLAVAPRRGRRAFVVVAREGVFELVPGRAGPHYLGFPGASAGASGEDGAVWVAVRPGVTRLPDERPGLSLETEEAAAAIAAYDSGRVAALVGGRLFLVGGDGAQPLSPERFEPAGPAHAIAALGRRVYVATDPAAPRLVECEPGREPRVFAELPGACLELAPWPGTGRLLARVIEGEEVRVLALDPERGLERIPALDGARALAPCAEGTGALGALLADGTAVRVGPKGEPLSRLPLDDLPGNTERLAVSGRLAAAIYRSAGAWWVQTLELDER